MLINMSCPACSKTLTAPETAIGKRARCPGCGQIMIVPATVPAEEFAHSPRKSVQRPLPSDCFQEVGRETRERAALQRHPRTARKSVGHVPSVPSRSLPVRLNAGSAARFLIPACAPVKAISAHGWHDRGLGGRSRKIRRYYKIWWINLVFGAGLCLTIVGMVVGIPMMIIGGIAYYRLLYQLWCTVQDGRAAATPGNAIGLLFVPLFGLYWQFVAFWGLSKDLNRVSREYNLRRCREREARPDRLPLALLRVHSPTFPLLL